MQNQDQQTQDPYLAYEPTVQEILYRTLDKPDFPLRAKLFSLACLAHEMDPFFQPQSGSFDLEKMAEVVDKLSGHQFELTWLEEIRDQEVDLELPMSVVLGFLLRAFRNADPEMEDLLPLAWERFLAAGSGADPFLEVDETEDTLHVKCADGATQYAQERDRLWSLFGTEIEAYIQNYCTHFVFAKSYTQCASLPEYVQEMVVRVMVLKFLLVNHPGVQEVLDLAQAAGTEDEDKKQDFLRSLDSQVMQIMKVFSANISSWDQALAALLQALREQGMQQVAHQAVMIHF